MDEDVKELEFVLTINGKQQRLRATPDMPLLWALRQEAGISGVKFGCGAGLCGACTVHLDGCRTTRSRRDCSMPGWKLT
jgi:isoquinoline 1-oxidoreductase alpha subunit